MTDMTEYPVRYQVLRGKNRFKNNTVNPVEQLEPGRLGLEKNDHVLYSSIDGETNFPITVENGAIITDKLSDSAVTTVKIADKNVTTAKLSDLSVTTAKLANASNTTNPNGVTTAKIENSAITTDKINNSAVTTAKIAQDSITASKLADDLIKTGSGSAEANDITVTLNQDGDPGKHKFIIGISCKDDSVNKAKRLDHPVTFKTVNLESDGSYEGDFLSGDKSTVSLGVTGILPVSNGGTNKKSFSNGAVYYSDGFSSGTLSVPYGGTGKDSWETHGPVIAEGDNSLTSKKFLSTIYGGLGLDVSKKSGALYINGSEDAPSNLVSVDILPMDKGGTGTDSISEGIVHSNGSSLSSISYDSDTYKGVLYTTGSSTPYFKFGTYSTSDRRAVYLGYLDVGKSSTTSDKDIYCGSIETTTLYTTSDRRLKKDIKSYNPSGSLLDLDVKTYKFKDKDDKTHIGLIAQDVKEVLPELVDGNEDTGFLSLKEDKIVYALLYEVQKLRDRITELENKLGDHNG